MKRIVIAGCYVFAAAVLGVLMAGCSASVTTDSSPEASTSPTLSSEDAANAVTEGIHSIQIGVWSWAVDNMDQYPDPSQVTASGLASYVDSWPTNPYTGQPTHESGYRAGRLLLRDGRVRVHLHAHRIRRKRHGDNPRPLVMSQNA